MRVVTLRLKRIRRGKLFIRLYAGAAGIEVDNESINSPCIVKDIKLSRIKHVE